MELTLGAGSGVARANAMTDDLIEWRRLATGRWENWVTQPAGNSVRSAARKPWWQRLAAWWRTWWRWG